MVSPGDRNTGLGAESLDADSPHVVICGDLVLPTDARTVHDVRARWERPPRLRAPGAAFPAPYLEGLLRLSVSYSAAEGQAPRWFEGVVEVLRFLDPDGSLAPGGVASRATALPRDIAASAFQWSPKGAGRIGFKVKESLGPAAPGLAPASLPLPPPRGPGPAIAHAAVPCLEAEVQVPVWTRECRVSQVMRVRLPTPLAALGDIEAVVSDVRLLRVGKKLELKCRLDVSLTAGGGDAAGTGCAAGQPARKTVSLDFGGLVTDLPGARPPAGELVGRASVGSLVARLEEQGRRLWLKATLDASVSACEARRIRVEAPSSEIAGAPSVLVARPVAAPASGHRLAGGDVAGGNATGGLPHRIDVPGTSPKLRLLPAEGVGRGSSLDLASAVSTPGLDVVPLRVSDKELSAAGLSEVPADVVVAREELPLLLEDRLELPPGAVKVVDTWLTVLGAWVRRSAAGVVVGGLLNTGAVCACRDALERTVTSTSPMVVRVGVRAGGPAPAPRPNGPKVEASARIKLETPGFTLLPGKKEAGAAQVAVAAPAVFEVILTSPSFLPVSGALAGAGTSDGGSGGSHGSGGSGTGGPTNPEALPVLPPGPAQGKAALEGAIASFEVPGGVTRLEGLETDAVEVSAEALPGVVRVGVVMDVVLSYAAADGIRHSIRRTVREHIDVAVPGTLPGSQCGACATVRARRCCLAGSAASEEREALVEVDVEARAWSRAAP